MTTKVALRNNCSAIAREISRLIDEIQGVIHTKIFTERAIDTVEANMRDLAGRFSRNEITYETFESKQQLLVAEKSRLQVMVDEMKNNHAWLEQRKMLLEDLNRSKINVEVSLKNMETAKVALRDAMTGYVCAVCQQQSVIGLLPEELTCEIRKDEALDVRTTQQLLSVWLSQIIRNSSGCCSSPVATVTPACQPAVATKQVADYCPNPHCANFAPCGLHP